MIPPAQVPTRSQDRDDRWRERTLPYALGLAVASSLQPILFSWLYRWAAGEQFLLDSQVFAAASLATLIAVSVALVVVRVVCARAHQLALGDSSSEENLASLLRHLSQQASTLRGRTHRDPDLSELLEEIEATAQHAADVIPAERELSIHRDRGRARPSQGIALVLAETFALRRHLVRYLTAEGFTVISSFLEDRGVDNLLARIPNVRLAVVESGENDFPAAEAVAAVRRFNPALPVVLLAALDLSPAEAQSVLGGPGAALPRQFSDDDLRAALDRALCSPRA